MSTGTELSTLLTTYMHNDVSLSAADKLIYLNLGLKRIIRDAPSAMRIKSGSITCAVGTQEYSLASDFYMMVGVWLQTNGIKLMPYAISEFIENVEIMPTIPSGPPDAYALMGYDESQETPAWRIRFNYNPDDTYAIEYWYNPIPIAITAGSTPALSTMGFDELLVWAAAMIALQPKDPEGHKIAAANYERNLAELRSYNPYRADYTPILRPDSSGFSRTPNPLGPHFPS